MKKTLDLESGVFLFNSLIPIPPPGGVSDLMISVFDLFILIPNSIRLY